jgi:hypothetical protein
MNRRRTLWLLLAAFGPLLLMSAYLVLSRAAVNDYSAVSDEVAEVLSCILGALGVAKSMPPEWPRVIVILIYLPLMGVFLSFYGLVFVCAIFRNCL